MDFQKNGFWIVVGAIAAIELAALGYLVFSVDGQVGEAAKKLERHEKTLQTYAKKPFIPSEKDPQEVTGRKKDIVKNLLKTVVHLCAVDEMTLEQRWVEGGKAVTENSTLRPLFQSTTAKLKSDLMSDEGKYGALKVAMVTTEQGDSRFPVEFPQPPNADEDIPAFYRKWWVMMMALDQVLLPGAAEAMGEVSGKTKAEIDQRKWQLLMLRFDPELDEEDEPPADKEYIAGYITVRLRLRMQVADADRLMQKAFNTRFRLRPTELSIWQSERDPSVIKIVVPPGQKQPSPAEIMKDALSKRPTVTVQLTLHVFDLEQEKLLDLGRKHRKSLGDRDQLTEFMESLDDDDFLKPYTGFDRKKFLARITDELMQE